MKNGIHAAVIITLTCLMCGCAGREAQEMVSDESTLSAESPKENTSSSEESKEPASGTKASKETGADMESETKKAEESEALGEGDEIWFMPPNSNTDFNFGVDEYDYVFYFRGFYLSNNGEADQIYIDPVEFVWNWETERWLAWGNSVEDGPYCEQRNEKEEVISIPLTENTEFYIYNDNDPVLYKICERSNGRECMTRDPETFLYYVQSQFSNCAEQYPFFMILNEDGTVKYVIEYPLV